MSRTALRPAIPLRGVSANDLPDEAVIDVLSTNALIKALPVSLG